MIRQIVLVFLVTYLIASQAEAAKSKIAKHVYSIEIAQGCDYGYPDADDTVYEFTFRVHTDSSVESVEFRTPEEETFPITKPPESEGTLYWEYYADYPDASSLAVYGDGDYTITVYYEGGASDQTTAWFGIPRSKDYMPQPEQEPVLVFPGNGDTTTSPVAFEWEPCTDTSTNLIVLNLENTTTGERTMNWFRPTKTEWKKARLSTGLWEADLSFGQRYKPYRNNDGIWVRVSKYSESDYTFEIDTD